ncbi:PAS domain-containing protein [Streptomyces sp. Ru73]|uniref:PAS domain-containing protein n=1 Tax=Streptomyces sp. Ru73 TaxID=2080748 RepID=UPI0011B05C96|nr:PAS domain-containing protein [Streptomyces sp. Ru73]
MAESQLFEATAAPYVLLDTDLHIRGVNPAYLRATGRSREELLGSFMFDAFPDNPADATADGVRNLGASLERVLRRSTPDEMGVQRYDIPDTGRPGAFRYKTWAPVNSPLTAGDGLVVGALHHVEDITAAYDALRGADGADPRDGVRQPAAVLRRAMLAMARHERAAAAGRPSPAPPRDGLARRDALWHRIVHTARRGTFGGCAEAVCAAAVRELPTVDAAAVTLHGPGSWQYQLAVSSPVAQRAEEAQWVTGEGPSRTAFDTGRPVLVPEVSENGAPWPLFTDTACRAGITAVFAYPLRTASATLGTLTLYRTGEGTAAAGPPADAETFAEIAAVVLLADLDTEIAERLRATADADDINTAIGVLAAVRHLSTQDAAALLRAMAESQGRPPADVARAVLVRYVPAPDERA